MAVAQRKVSSPAVTTSLASSSTVDLTLDIGPARPPATPPPLRLVETESIRHLLNNSSRKNAQRFLSFDWHGVLDRDLECSARLLDRILSLPSNGDLEIVVVGYSVRSDTRQWTSSQLQTLLSKVSTGSFSSPHPRIVCLYTRTKFLYPP